MGQKTHPKGFRLGRFRNWDSRWFAEKEYRTLLEEDLRIRNFIDKNYRTAAIASVEIERFGQRIKINLHTARPGIIIGRRGSGVEEIRKSIERLTKRAPGQININVQEVKQPELEAKLIGENIADQLEKRVAFRRAMKQAASRAMKGGAKGIRIQVSGRLAGSDIARTERTQAGRVPLHTLRADIDFCVSESDTTFGKIGVQVWVNRGEMTTEAILLERGRSFSADAEKSKIS